MNLRATILTAISALIVGLYAAIFVPPPPADAAELAGVKVTSYAANTDNSTSGPITLVASNATKPISTYGIFLNTLTADSVTVKCGTTVVQPFNFGANGGVTLIPYPIRLYRCAANEALTATKGVSTTVLNWGVWYLQQE